MSFYGLLMQFTNGTTPCRQHLMRRFPKIVDQAIELGYIVEIRCNEDGDPVYAITELGKRIRDK